MQYSKLGRSGEQVSRVCLGSMTWGRQNSQQEADAQIDYALGQGVNFIDTAEMYPVPPNEETYGGTERVIGDWLSRHSEKRHDVIIASKIAGPGLSYIRDGKPITGENVIKAVDSSLKRLNTDYIDLFQLHWPNRTSPHFGKHFPNSFKFSEVNGEQQEANMLDILQGLDSCVKAGKIRFCGLSDDTTWGISQYLKLSEQHNLPAMVSIQNEFNLLHSKDWPYLIEHCVHEDIAFLPWSPLAGGMLSGKYLDGKRPQGSRWTISQRLGLFRNTEQSERAITAYCEVARDHGITPAQLALAWCDKIDGVTSTIIGATKMEQLKENIEAFDVDWTEQLASDTLTVLKQYTVAF